MVEINLLEEKEKQNIVIYFIVLIGLIVMVSLVLYFVNTRESLAEEKATLNQQINELQNQQQFLQQASRNEKQAAREDLIKKADTVEAYIFPSVDLLKQLISLLPSRGYFITYSYEGDGKILMDVQFDSIQDIAQYTNELEHEAYINSLRVSMSTKEVPEDEMIEDVLPIYLAKYELVIDSDLWQKEMNLDEN